MILLGSTALAYTPNSRSSISGNRRAFLSKTASAGLLLSGLVRPPPSEAADIKVTAIAHTFVTSSGAAKPLRENDATRLLTNAKVVYLFTGTDTNPSVSADILDLTAKRKEEKGPGVTPGDILVATNNPSMIDAAKTLGLAVEATKDSTPTSIASAASKMSEGGVVIVGPLSSGGTAKDAMIVAETAKSLGVEVGGAKSGGVLSVLVDGPRKGLLLEEEGLPVSTVLWYSI